MKTLNKARIAELRRTIAVADDLRMWVSVPTSELRELCDAWELSCGDTDPAPAPRGGEGEP